MGLKVAILLACHNRRDTTIACLEGVIAQRSTGFELTPFVVDDGSTDGTADAVEQLWPGARVIAGDGHLYWNGAMRMAFHAAMREGYDFYLWLNDDTVLYPGAIRRLVETHQEVRAQGKPAIVVGATRDPVTGRLTYSGVVRVDRIRRLRFEKVTPGRDPRKCDTMNGNCVLVSEEVAKICGNLDPVFRHAMADFDYGLRARQNRCDVWLAPGFMGTCTLNEGQDPTDSGLWSEWRRLTGPKELPLRAWATFVRRYGGPAWFPNLVFTYVRRTVAMLRSRAHKRSR